MFLQTGRILFSGLTSSLKKQETFSNDFYFELSYKMASQILNRKMKTILKNYVFLLIKPEAFITNKIDILIKDLKEYHFELVYVSLKPINHTQISELWKYMWSGASLMRIITNQEYYSRYMSGLLILRNTKYNDTDLCSFMTKIKGSSSNGHYKESTIRYHMNSINTFLNYIHSPDEIADFMREIAVFFQWNELNEIYNRIFHESSIDFVELENLATIYPYRASPLPCELILDTLLQNIQNEIHLTNQDSQELALLDIYNKLLAVKRKNIKFTYDLYSKMCSEGVFEWSWPMFILVTTYMEFFNGYQTIF